MARGMLDQIASQWAIEDRDDATWTEACGQVMIEPMKRLALVLALLALAAPARGQDGTVSKPLKIVTWSDLKESGAPIPGTILPPTEDRLFEALRVENKTGKARTITVVTLDNPGISEAQWTVTGQVRYEKVLGKGYLELLNHLSDGGVYFTRTLANDGPMGYLNGNSGWREFALPFNALKQGNRPTRLVISVVLPQRGVVDLSPLSIYQGSPPAGP